MLFANVIGQYLERTVLKGSSWIFKSLIIIILFAICVNFGFDLKRWAYIKNFAEMVSGGHVNPQLCCYYWSDIAYQTTDMLMQRLQVWDTVHQANMRFRPVLPVLWMLFHSAIAIYCFQILLGVGQLYMTIRIIYSITQDRLQAFYFTLGFAGLYSGAAFYLDFYGFGDAFAYAFITAAVYFRKPYLICLSVLLASFVDERALFNSSFIILFHWIVSTEKAVAFTSSQNLAVTPPYTSLPLREWSMGGRNDRFQSVLSGLSPQVWAVLLGGLIYMVIRLDLTFYYHLKIPVGGPSPFFYVREASKAFGIRLWTGFESFWILILVMLPLLYYRRSFVFLTLVLVLICLTTFTFLLQGDHTRTAAYGFPLFFVAMLLIKEGFTQEELRITLLIISTISTFFFPILY